MKSLTDYRLSENNPRSISPDKFEKLKQSIKDLPKMMELRPIVVDSDNVVLAGNMRFKALLDMGYSEVPDEWIMDAGDMTESQKAEFIVKDNVSLGAWDFEALSTNWDKDSLIQWGFEIYDFGTSTDILDSYDYGDDDYEEGSDIESTPTLDKPKVTDNGYVKYEIILKEEDKKELVSLLASIKKEQEVTLAEALMIIVKSYTND